VPWLISDNSEQVYLLQSAIKSPDTILIFGADRIDGSSKGWEEGSDKVWYNSMYVVSKNKILNIYDKVKLLPFGEYVPFHKFFPKFFNYILSGVDCSEGVAKEIPTQSYTFLPKICSESFFKYKVGEAKWIVQILNDGWFGPSLRAQHLAIDRLRVVQANLPLVRVSNNGISAVLDLSAKILTALPENCQAKKFVQVEICKQITQLIEFFN
jgi:apolipoprotein N-acyltransferase